MRVRFGNYHEAHTFEGGKTPGTVLLDALACALRATKEGNPESESFRTALASRRERIIAAPAFEAAQQRHRASDHGGFHVHVSPTATHGNP